MKIIQSVVSLYFKRIFWLYFAIAKLTRKEIPRYAMDDYLSSIVFGVAAILITIMMFYLPGISTLSKNILTSIGLLVYFISGMSLKYSLKNKRLKLHEQI